MDRPRAKGAKYTNRNIAADEKVQDIQLKGFEAKRDRWNGYTADEWAKQAEKFEKVAEIRQRVRQKEMLDMKFRGELEENADVEGELKREEDKVEENEEGGFAKVEMRVRSAGGGSTGTVRNLRIREDTAKYLLNLDLDSAYYDPKSRSMREDPNPEKDPSEKVFAGDNFVRQSGASQGFQQLNLFSVTATEKGQDVHMQAMPSQAEISYRAVQERKNALKSSSKKNIEDKYGNAAEALPDDIKALKATEAYVEYDASGRLIRGHEHKVQSRYEEDVHPGNHTSVWGSWYCNGSWGYACCHSLQKNAYCTGEDGKKAAATNRALQEQNMERIALEDRKKEAEDGLNGALGNAAGTSKPPLPNSAIWGTDADKEHIELDDKKLREAMARQQERNERAEADDRKRGYNSIDRDSHDVTAEDMEAYRLKRSRGDDPLASIEKAKAQQQGSKSYDYV